MRRSIPCAVTAVLLVGTSYADPKDVFGSWATPAGDAHVTIGDCGDGSPCGRVSWMNPASMRADLTPETATDENNPDPDLRSEPVLGLLMLSEFEEKRGDWRGGRIYDPETGRTYGSRLKRLDDGTLQVKGCIGPICQTQVWTPVEGETAIVPSGAPDQG